MTGRTETGTGHGADRSAPLVRVRGVTKGFGGVAALKDVDLDLYPGRSTPSWA